MNSRTAGRQQQPKVLERLSSEAVSSWIRFLNFFIDFSIWLVLAFTAIVLLDHFLPTVDHFTINALAYTVMAGLFLAYYLILESRFQKTVGKFITGTKVVRLNGEKAAAGVIVRRTLFRLIPLDWISYFFFKNGMHDSLSGTIVVKDRGE